MRVFNLSGSLRIEPRAAFRPRTGRRSMSMKAHHLASLAAFVLCGSAHADGLHTCDFESDYDLRIEPRGVVFHRSSGTPGRVEMQAGRLLVDGREIALSAADRERVHGIEARIRELVPEVKALALDGVGIATEAVTQVALAFADGDADKVVGRMDELGAELRARIERSDDSGDWNDAEFERAIGRLTGEIVPLLVGDITSLAVKAALSGDDSGARALEQRVEAMERELEQRVEQRSRSLEARADALCPRIEELDRLESALEVRLAGNQALELLRAER
jgi:hypothetical protein